MMNAQHSYIITADNSKRIAIFKLWLTIMVVYLHSYSDKINLLSGQIVFDMPQWLYTLKYLISQSIARCAVPSFFLLSAILLYRNPFSWGDNLRKKIRTLLVPYLLLNSFWIIIFNVAQKLPILQNYFSNSQNIIANWGLYEWLKAYGLTIHEPFLYPLWFIQFLLLLNILSFFLKNIVDCYPRISLFLLVIIWFFPFHISGHITQSFCFWIGGMLIVRYKIKLDYLDRKRFLISVIYVFSIFFDCFLKGTLLGFLSHQLSCIMGIAFWFSCATIIRNEKLNNTIIYFSSFAFPIFLFHEMNLTILKKLHAKFFSLDVFSQVIGYLFIPIIIICVCVIFSIFLKQSFPNLYGLLTGGRNWQPL